MTEKLREDLSAEAQLCGMSALLDTVGEKWCFMILRAALNGVTHFEGFLEAIGIARNILSNRLARLVEHGLMTRTQSEEDRRRVVYLLTDKGQDLLVPMVAMRQWGEKWETGVPSNPVLADSRDRRPIATVRIFSHDGRPLPCEELCWIDRAELAGKRARDAEVRPLATAATRPVAERDEKKAARAA